jgi:hypothetical protein
LNGDSRVNPPFLNKQKLLLITLIYLDSLSESANFHKHISKFPPKNRSQHSQLAQTSTGKPSPGLGKLLLFGGERLDGSSELFGGWDRR